jgi:hypothetical protein
MAEDVPADVLAPFVLACDQYPYHELVAYACGRTIGELRDWLERGAAGSADTPNLNDFAREYCRKDADFGREIFAIIKANCMPGAKANVGPLWKWFDTRWPCGEPLAITTLLASQRVEVLSLEQTFADPSQPIREALTATNWFHVRDLDNPSVELTRALTEAGYRRESDARPGPRSTEES